MNSSNNQEYQNAIIPIQENFQSHDKFCFSTPKLMDVNYDLFDTYKDKKIKKEDIKYYLEGVDELYKDFPKDGDNPTGSKKPEVEEIFHFLIEDVQPFHKNKNNDEDFDVIGDIRQSQNHIWVMNHARTRLRKASKNKLENKLYIDVLQELDKYENNFKFTQIITAWGVSDDELPINQYICIFVKSYEQGIDSYFILAKVNYLLKIQVYVKSKDELESLVDKNTSDLMYIKLGNIEINGSIYLKYNYELSSEPGNEAYKLYSLYCVKQTTSNSEIMRYDIDVISKQKITEVRINSLPNNGLKLDRIPMSNDDVKNIIGIIYNKFKEKIYNTFNIFGNKSKYLVDARKLNYLLKLDDLLADELFQNKERIKITEYYNYNKLEDLQAKRFLIYKRLALFLYLYGYHKYDKGIFNLKVDYEDEKLYFSKILNSQIEIKKIKKKISELNTIITDIQPSDVQIAVPIKYISDAFKSTASYTKNNFKLLDEVIVLSSNLLSNAKKEIQVLSNQQIEFDADDDRLHYLHTYANLPYKSPDKKTQNLSKFYKNFYNDKYHLQDSGKHVIGVLKFNNQDYDSESSPKIKNLIKQPRNVIYTIYQKIVNTLDAKTTTFSRYNTTPITVSSSECIPAQKYNYNHELLREELDGKSSDELPQGVNNIDKISLFQLFKNNMLTPKESYDPQKLLNLGDWVYIYELMRSEGIYDLKRQDPLLEILNNSIENNLYFNKNADKWTGKHQGLLIKNRDDVFEETVLKNFPNILIFDLNGEKLDVIDEQSGKEKKVYLHLKFNEINNTDPKFSEDMSKGDVVDEDFNFLKLEYDNSRGDVNEPSNSEIIDDKKYDYYKLTITPKRSVLRLDYSRKSPYIWFKKTITNFEIFKNFVYDNIDNEEDSRDRLRGLYEIPDMYVDDEYITNLEDSRTGLDTEKINKLIDAKKKIRDINVTVRKDGEKKIRENVLGYPFVVFYKYIDYHGYPCEPHAKFKQKIILSNRLLIKNIISDPLKSTKLPPFTNKKFRYPLIKQEFLSFSGNGNTIQYYEKKFGGITNIDPKKLCGQKESTFIDACDKDPNSECQETVLSLTSISGTPKCEIDDASVVKTSSSPVEVLVPQAVPKNACKIYIVKGNMKIYYSLGKIFGHGKNKYQYKGIYTVKNKENKYFYVNGNDVLETDESMVVDDLGEVKDEFKFYTRIKEDNYGKYYILESYVKKNNYLTAKIHSMQHTLGGNTPLEAIPKIIFTLESEKKVNDRNLLTDEDYYSQKFNLSDALMYKTASEDPDNELTKELLRKKSIQDSLAAQFFPELAYGDKSYREPMTTKEEEQALERLLNDINSYLKKVTRLNPIELPDVEALSQNLESVIKMMKSRVPLIKERMQAIKYQVKFENKLELPSIYSNFSYPPIDSRLENVNESQNNISNNIKKMDNEQMIQQMGSALQSIKDFMPRSTRNPQQCKSLVEGFENMYDSNELNNHLVDKYNDFVNSRVGRTETSMSDKKNTLFNRLKEVGGKINALKMDGSNNQVKITQEIEDGMDIKGSLYQIRDGEQKKRMDRMEQKLDEIDKLRCQLGDISIKTKVKDHPNFNSIISREDGSLLNVYKINDCDKVSEEDKKLNQNMIFVNGGCLSYDEDTRKMKVEHCMVNDNKQLFELHKLQEQNELQAFNVRNNLKPGEMLENPHYIITKPRPDAVPPPSEGPSESKYSSDVCDYNYAKFNSYTSDVNEKTCQKHKSTNLCLNTTDGELSMRDCSNVKPQQWDYSDITGPCK